MSTLKCITNEEMVVLNEMLHKFIEGDTNFLSYYSEIDDYFKRLMERHDIIVSEYTEYSLNHSGYYEYKSLLKKICRIISYAGSNDTITYLYDDWEAVDEDFLSFCEDCGKIINTDCGDGCYYIEGYGWICENCYDNDSDYFYCEGHNEYEHGDHIEAADTGYVYCTDYAYDHLYHCESCGVWYENEDRLYYDEDTEEYYCESCWDNDRPNSRNAISSYHTSKDIGDYRHLTMPDEKDPLLFGFELEVECEGCDKFEVAKKIRDKYINKEHMIVSLENDGSLDYGFEIISQPMSFKWFIEHKNLFDEMLDLLKENHCSSHDNGKCGLHFHISGLNQEQRSAMYKIVHDKWEDFIVPFSRRTHFNYCSKIYLKDKIQVKNYREDIVKDLNTINRIITSDTLDTEEVTTVSQLLDKIKDRTKHKKLITYRDATLKDIEKELSYNQSHSYAFILNAGHDTCELRVMRGTLNNETFETTFDFVNALARTCKENKKPTFKKALAKINNKMLFSKYLSLRKIDLNIDNEDFENFDYRTFTNNQSEREVM